MTHNLGVLFISRLCKASASVCTEAFRAYTDKTPRSETTKVD